MFCGSYSKNLKNFAKYYNEKLKKNFLLEELWPAMFPKQERFKALFTVWVGNTFRFSSDQFTNLAFDKNSPFLFESQRISTAFVWLTKYSEESLTNTFKNR